MWPSKGIEFTEKLVTPNNNLVVSLDDFKQHINWDADDDSQDTVMTAFIKAATEQAQQFTDRQFLNATWTVLLRQFPSRIALPKSPCSAVSSVKYYDLNNTLQTLSATEYKVKDGGAYGHHIVEFDGTIPAVHDKPDAIIIEYVAGYGAAASSVPNALVVAIMIQAANYFANRESEQTGTNAVQLMNGFHQLLYPYKTFYHNAA
jgi:uncharacterized phiE125 gp8 family phage protein